MAEPTLPLVQVHRVEPGLALAGGLDGLSRYPLAHRSGRDTGRPDVEFAIAEDGKSRRWHVGTQLHSH